MRAIQQDSTKSHNGLVVVGLNASGPRIPDSPSENSICAISCPPGSVRPTQILYRLEDCAVTVRLVRRNLVERFIVVGAMCGVRINSFAR